MDTAEHHDYLGKIILVCLFLFLTYQDGNAQIFKPKAQVSQTQSKAKTALKSEPKVAAKSQNISELPHKQWSNAWRITMAGGMTYQVCDIREYRFYEVFRNINDWRYGGSLMLERQLSPVFSLRGQGFYGVFAGTAPDLDRKFKAENIEGTLSTSIDLNNLFGRNRNDRAFTLNLILGAGLANYSTTLSEISTGNTVRRSGFGTGLGLGGRLLDALVMAGLGADFRLDDHWSLRLESVNRMLNSDLLDLTEGGRKYDAYNYSSVGISYTFGSNRRVSKVPESEPFVIVEKQTEPVRPTASFNQVIDILAVDSLEVKHEVIETFVPVETTVQKTVEKETSISGIEYRIQIRARYEGKVSIGELSKKYNIPESEIYESTHNRYYIYTVGSFASYEQAAEKRNDIRSVNKVYDAFIVVFKNGSYWQI
jgi:hypothetical protein